MEPDDGWTTPSDLADYAYCPRSHWYRHHPPAGGRSRGSEARARAGLEYHRKVLTAERHRAERGGAYWVALLLGVVLVLGGAWWLFRF